MAQPVFVVAMFEVVLCVRTTAFLARFCRHHRGACHFDQVRQFQRFNAGRVEHLRLVLQMHVVDALSHFADTLHAFGKQLRGAEHAGVCLHRGADVVGHVLRVFARRGLVELVETREREISGVSRQRLMFLDFPHVLDDMVAG
jgi:hypothetical protein